MKIRYAVPALAAAAVLVLTGCTNDDRATEEQGSGAADVQPDKAAVALLPDGVKDSGELVPGTDADYPPNEYKDSNGATVPRRSCRRCCSGCAAVRGRRAGARTSARYR